ncbi:hypothetical protein BKA69DRAFT_1073188 [Paraphysoderma sedebokerense]|nr:hypothetical protein BKA69DRAFT_1073188 [Paraphysoderma sedebokerense]
MFAASMDINDDFGHGYDLERRVHDPIHSTIRLDNKCWDIIDTPQFQRLRHLKQLGVTYYVFPGGGHNRFEHSIGVGHLAGTLIERIRSNQPYLKITDEEVECVRIAGLCHDLGHGPFSHLFDGCFIPRVRPESNWSHEVASNMMLDYLIDENSIDLDSYQVDLIKDLIMGRVPHEIPSGRKKYLYQIVANKSCGIDVDRFDYLQRDCYNLGIKSSYDFERLMWNCRVIGDDICYNIKELDNVNEMFNTRYSLMKRIYRHRKSTTLLPLLQLLFFLFHPYSCSSSGQAIECMITDALVAADPVMKMSDMIDDRERYLHLTDDILGQIERSIGPELAQARGILTRLANRQLYKMVDECTIEKSDKLEWKVNDS